MAEIYTKIAKVLNDVGAVAKNEKNKDQGFNFRGIDSVVNAVNPHLKANNLFIAHEVLEHNLDRFENASKKIVTNVTVRVKYTWFAEDGSSIENVAIGEGRDFADKATAKAMSVAFRTHLLQLLALPTDDKDPDAESIEIDTAPAAAPAAPKGESVADLQNKIRGIIQAPNATYTNDIINALGNRISGGKVPAVWMKQVTVLKAILAAVEKGEVA
jgi:hypothetical protein